MALEDITNQTVSEGITFCIGQLLSTPENYKDSFNSLNYIGNYVRSQSTYVSAEDVRDKLEDGLITFLIRDEKQKFISTLLSYQRKLLAFGLPTFVASFTATYYSLTYQDLRPLIGACLISGAVLFWALQRKKQIEESNQIPEAIKAAKEFYQNIQEEDLTVVVDEGIKPHLEELKKQKYI